MRLNSKKEIKLISFNTPEFQLKANYHSCETKKAPKVGAS